MKEPLIVLFTFIIAIFILFIGLVKINNSKYENLGSKEFYGETYTLMTTDGIVVYLVEDLPLGYKEVTHFVVDNKTKDELFIEAEKIITNLEKLKE